MSIKYLNEIQIINHAIDQEIMVYLIGRKEISKTHRPAHMYAGRQAGRGRKARGQAGRQAGGRAGERAHTHARTHHARWHAGSHACMQAGGQQAGKDKLPLRPTVSFLRPEPTRKKVGRREVAHERTRKERDR